MKKKIVNVKDEVRQLNQRVNSLRAIQRMILTVQMRELKVAEKIRRAAKELAGSARAHQCSDRVGHCIAISANKLLALQASLRDVGPFHRNRRIPAAVKKFMRQRP